MYTTSLYRREQIQSLVCTKPNLLICCHLYVLIIVFQVLVVFSKHENKSAPHLDVNFRLLQIPVWKIVAADSAGGAFDDADIKPVRLSLPVLDI